MTNRRTLLLLITLCLVASSANADTLKHPQQILIKLKHDFIMVGETSKHPKDFADALDDAREQIINYIRKGDAAALNERDAMGMTPLMTASFEGFTPIVEELLKNKEVLAHIDDTDAKGISAWTYATIAPKQTLWICNPSILQNAFLLTPLRVVQPYYDSAESPYYKVRDLLKKAGAKTDADAAKSKWSYLCRAAYPSIAKEVFASSDILKTLLDQAQQYKLKR